MTRATRTALSAAFVVALGAALVAQDAVAGTLQPGSALPALALSDQHDAPAPLPADTRLLLVSRDMDGGDVVKKALAEDGAARLAAAKAVYVADISRMPGFVTNMFALPAMRKRGYTVVLDRDGKATADVPFEEGKVTVLSLDAGSVTAVRFVATAAELDAVLAGR